MTSLDTKGPEDLIARPEWLLIKRGLFYRPDAQGYTGVRAEAGRYTEAEARARIDEGVTMVLAPDAPEFTPECWPEVRERILRAKVEALTAEVETLKRERDAALGLIKLSRTAQAVDRERIRAEAAEAKVATLCRVSDPFVAVAIVMDGGVVRWGDDYVPILNVPMGAYRRLQTATIEARSALSNGSTE